MIINMAARGATVDVPVFRITSEFGAKESFREYAHRGLDFSMDRMTELHPLMSGEITRVVDQGSQGLGKGVFLKMENGETAIYGHLEKVNVSPGDVVDPSDVIGWSGSTGHSTGNHLHLGILDQSGNYADPSVYEPIVQSWDHAAPQIIPDPFDLIMGGLEKGRDLITDAGSDAAASFLIWLGENLKVAGLVAGKWLLTVGPDTAIVVAMVFCLGAIMNIPNAYKFTVGSTILAVVLEVFRMGVLGS